MIENASPKVAQFTAALNEAEESGAAEPLAGLFADDAQLTNYAVRREGAEGARLFWQDYLKLFQRLRSSFSRVLESGDSYVLFWNTEGVLSNGKPIHYEGVSVLDYDGEKIAKFSTYYDSAAFTPPSGAGR